MAVVAAFKLQNLAATGSASSEADGAHAGLRAAAHQTHHVHAGDEGEDGLCQFHLALRGGAKREAVERRFLHRLQHRGVPVTQDHGAPRADVVDVTLAVSIPKVGALGSLHEARGSTHGFECTNRRVHPAGDHAFGAFEEFCVTVCHKNACQLVSCGIRGDIKVGLNGWSNAFACLVAIR